MQNDPPRIIEIDSNDIERVVRDVIDSENMYNESEKRTLLETVY